MLASNERKTNGRWNVAYIDPQQVSKPQHTFIMSDHLRKQIEEEAKTLKKRRINKGLRES
jgi:hypothetical protein